MSRPLIVSLIIFVSALSISAAPVYAADLKLIEKKVVETAKTRTQKTSVSENIQESNKPESKVNQIAAEQKVIHWSLFNDTFVLYTSQGQLYLHLF